MITLEQIKTLINGVLLKIPKPVNPDWNESDPTKPSHILHRPFYTNKGVVKKIDRVYIPDEFQNKVEYFDLDKYSLGGRGYLYEGCYLDSSWKTDLVDLIFNQKKLVVICGTYGTGQGEWGTGSIIELRTFSSGNNLYAEDLFCTIGAFNYWIRGSQVWSVQVDATRQHHPNSSAGQFVSVSSQGSFRTDYLVPKGTIGQTIRVAAVNNYGQPTKFEAGDAIQPPGVAQVGQVLQVTEIDETGKPTKWDAVDLPKTEEKKYELIDSITLTEETTELTWDFSLDKLYVSVTNRSGSSVYLVTQFVYGGQYFGPRHSFNLGNNSLSNADVYWQNGVLMNWNFGSARVDRQFDLIEGPFTKFYLGAKSEGVNLPAGISVEIYGIKSDQS